MNKRDQLKALYAQMCAFTEAHPNMSDEQVTEYEALEAKYDALDKDIAREDRAAARAAHMKAPTTTPIVDADGDEPKSGVGSKEYKASFDSAIRGANPLEIRAAMTEGTDADGGYVVPEVYQNAVYTKLNSIGRTRRISNVVKTTSTTNIPLEGDAPTFAWIEETGAYGETKSTFSNAQLKAYKLGGIIKVSDELLQDTNISFEDYMAGQIALGIDKAESPAFATGDGTNKPTGYAYAATVGASSTTASTTAVTADELINIFYDLKEEYRANATWRMNDKTEKAIRKLKDSNNNYLFDAAMTSGVRPTLLGRPIEIDNSLDDMAAGKKFIIIGDFANYQIADRGDLTIKRLNELYAGNGMVGFQVTKRVDAKLILAEAFNAGKNAAA